MAGLKKNSPSLPRYEESYSIAPILDFIIALGSNDVMSFDQLRSKVVILLQVFSLKRSKDVASIVSSSVVLNFDSKVSHFRMKGTLSYITFCRKAHVVYCLS